MDGFLNRYRQRFVFTGRGTSGFVHAADTVERVQNMDLLGQLDAM